MLPPAGELLNIAKAITAALKSAIPGIDDPFFSNNGKRINYSGLNESQIELNFLKIRSVPIS